VTAATAAAAGPNHYLGDTTATAGRAFVVGGCAFAIPGATDPEVIDAFELLVERWISLTQEAAWPGASTEDYDRDYLKMCVAAAIAALGRSIVRSEDSFEGDAAARFSSWLDDVEDAGRTAATAVMRVEVTLSSRKRRELSQIPKLRWKFVERRVPNGVLSEIRDTLFTWTDAPT
jgi:hypothetical protein